ncbi:MAG: hypothetical protein P1U36_06940 [Legionellaceae bacterium]|nr:hypothetical protein [Legionellaceae bacterium]
MSGTLEARMLQMACRAAVNQSPGITPPPLEGLQAKVEERFDTFKEGAMSITSIIAHNQTAAAIVAGGVVLGLVSAVGVVSKSWKTISEKHAKLEEEIKEKVSMFGVRESGVKPKPTFEQKLVRDYYLELNKELWLMRYSGIRRIEAAEPGAKTIYFVLPFYTMDTKVLKPLASMNAVDRVRNLIDKFLRIKLPEALEAIELEFEYYKQYTLYSAGKYVAEKGNFLNSWRSARFIMITLGNLLWNLQHPGDLKTGHHVSTETCIKYCDRVLVLLNSLLNPQEAPFLVHTDMFGRVHQESQYLVKFITSVQLLVKNLRLAYRYDQVNTINIADLTNTSHRVLGTLNTSLFKLLYQRDSKEAKMMVPDERAADRLSSCFDELTLVLQSNNAIVDVFQPYVKKFPDIPYLNYNVTTLIDILIIFTHLPYADRTALIAALKEKTKTSGEPSWNKFTEGLETLELRFIKPIARQDQSNPLYQNAPSARITGRRLVPFFTLLMAALRTDVDTGNSYQLAKNEQHGFSKSSSDAEFSSPFYDSFEENARFSERSDMTSRSTLNMSAHLNSTFNIQRTGRQQIEAINFQARQAEDMEDAYFSWRVELFTKDMQESAKAFMRQIHRLPLEADQLIEIVKILDAIAAVRDLDPIVLQEEAFKHCFLLYLRNMKEAFRTFNQKLSRAGESISSDEGVSPQMQSLFSNMMEEMEGSLQAVDAAANTLTSIIDNPNFMNEEKKSLATLIRYIEHSYTTLFPDDKKPNITALLSMNDEALGGHQRHYETRETCFTGKMAKKSTTRRVMSALMHPIKAKHYDVGVQTLENDAGFVHTPPRASNLSFHRQQSSVHPELLQSHEYAHEHDEEKYDSDNSNTSTLDNSIHHTAQSHSSMRCMHDEHHDVSHMSHQHLTLYQKTQSPQKKNEVQTIALQLWMDQCLDQMSSLSRYEYKTSYLPSLSFGGIKGKLLDQLIQEVSTKSPLNDEELTFYFLNLVRVIGSYRETPLGLFQAEWGRTRAMAPILNAIKNPTYNRMFPFNRLLFKNKKLDLDCLTDDELIKELMTVCQAQQWELSVDKINASSLEYDEHEYAMV